jgi:protein SCO1/2
MSRIRLFLVAFAIGLVGVAGVSLISQQIQKAQFTLQGVAVDPPRPTTDFTLTTSAQKQVRLSDFRGQFVLLFFGYRFCPDVCPLTLQEVKKALQTLGPQAERVQVLMVSVDPERDPPDLIDAHVKQFNANFIGLSGTPEEVAVAAKAFSVYYAKEAGSVNTGYLVSHSASITVINPAGNIVEVFPFGLGEEAIAADLQAWLAR